MHVSNSSTRKLKYFKVEVQYMIFKGFSFGHDKKQDILNFQYCRNCKKFVNYILS